MERAELLLRRRRSRHVPAPPASAQNAQFSPDGQALLFTLFHNGYNLGPAGLYQLGLADRTARPLLDEPDRDSVNLPGSSWNAATGRIAFASDREATDEIWTLAAGGGDLFRVTRHTSPDHFIEPSFSPDGKWIVFQASPDAPEDEGQGSLWKVRADGAELTQLTGGADDRQPNWSPVGDRILFQRRTPGSDDWNLFTMALDGSDLRQVTTASSEDTDASWSPDGLWIVYSSDHGGLPAPAIFVISAQGGAPIRTTHADGYSDYAPSWSPDGKWIAFESRLGEREETPTSLWRTSATLTAHSSPLPTPAPTESYFVVLRVEPVIVGDLGDRVTGPATVFVEAPGAASVEVYVQPLDAPYGKPLTAPTLIGADIDSSDGFAVYWPADEPYDAVQLIAVAYGQPDVNYARSSLPYPILLDWLHASQTAAAQSPIPTPQSTFGEQR